MVNPAVTEHDERRWMTTSAVARLREYTAVDGSVQQPHRDQASEWCRRFKVRRHPTLSSATGEALWDAEDVQRANEIPRGAGKGNRKPRTPAQIEAARKSKRGKAKK